MTPAVQPTVMSDHDEPADVGSARSEVETAESAIDPAALTVPAQSLHPRVRYLWTLRVAIGATIIAAVIVVASQFGAPLGVEIAAAAWGVIFVLGTTVALLRYRVWEYEIREDGVYLKRGVFTRVRTVVPFVRIQHVDTSRQPLERGLGLASSVVYTAGSRGADVTIPGLTAERAEDIQRRLKRLTIAAGGDVDQAV